MTPGWPCGLAFRCALMSDMSLPCAVMPGYGGPISGCSTSCRRRGPLDAFLPACAPASAPLGLLRPFAPAAPAAAAAAAALPLAASARPLGTGRSANWSPVASSGSCGTSHRLWPGSMFISQYHRSLTPAAYASGTMRHFLHRSHSSHVHTASLPSSSASSSSSSSSSSCASGLRLSRVSRVRCTCSISLILPSCVSRSCALTGGRGAAAARGGLSDFSARLPWSTRLTRSLSRTSALAPRTVTLAKTNGLNRFAPTLPSTPPRGRFCPSLGFPGPPSSPRAPNSTFRRRLAPSGDSPPAAAAASAARRSPSMPRSDALFAVSPTCCSTASG
mmetsp:Transcript_27881/g.70714  ORF Transcript_27881/g.70714 Transcript_27881/m.70714 type:complete len:332 (-) Transcript_27881:335-1330(-)